MLVALLAVASILGLIAGGMLLYLQLKVKGGDQTVENLAQQEASEPMNVLLLGSDSREDLTDEQKKSFGEITGKRADTIMLLHLDDHRDKVVLVSFPRDLRVVSPDGEAVKINSIYQLGADAVVSTLSNFTGLPIHHYVEVDFNGFNEITRTIGGVRIYFERALQDRDSGLDVPRGCVPIEGDQALAFVRARKIDDDFGRIRRQQLFLKLMAEKINAPGTLLRPDKVLSLVNVFSENVKHDAELTLADIKNIALRLRVFDSGNLDMRVVPSAGARIQGVEFVLANEGQSAALFEAIGARTALPPFGRTGVSAIDPADVQVSLLNGTDVDKLAAGEADQLRAKGFQVSVGGNAPAHPITTVYFDDGFEEQARLLSGIYPGAVEPRVAGIVTAAPVALVLGADFAASRAATLTAPGPGGEQAPAAVLSPAPPAAPLEPAPTPDRPLVRACAG
ncbi:MAG: LCP family protein [Actinomycetota bacterium]